MRKAMVVLLAAALVGGLVAGVPAEAKKRKKKTTRTAEAEYVVGSGLFAIYTDPGVGGQQFETGSTEQFVTVEVVDASGQQIGFDIGQDLNDDAQADSSSPQCGKTAAPVLIQGGYPVTVFIGSPTACGAPTFGTQGTIKITFSNLP